MYVHICLVLKAEMKVIIALQGYKMPTMMFYMFVFFMCLCSIVIQGKIRRYVAWSRIVDTHQKVSLQT